ncbi:hypothetical protein PO124_16515 [Bacillus licheniformis]|nr:hypothetical protein [Bacillus licheniformis]
MPAHRKGKESAAYLQKEMEQKPQARRSLTFLLTKNRTSGWANPHLQGTMEIANQMNTLAKGLSQHGALAHTLNYYPYYLNYAADYTWSLLKERNTPAMNAKLRRLANDLLPSYDCSISFRHKLHAGHVGLSHLKQAEKPMVMHHWGSDVRLYSTLAKTNPYAVVKRKRSSNSIPPQTNFPICPALHRRRYGALRVCKDYYEHVHMIPTMIQLDRYTPDYRSNESRSSFMPPPLPE